VFTAWGSIMCVSCMGKSSVCILCGEVYYVYTVWGSLVRVYCVEKASVYLLCGRV